MSTGHNKPSISRAKLASTMGKASILMEAMPYIRRFAGAIVVIKYGGSAMVDRALQDSFAADVSLLSLVGLRPVVVHGGGPQISKAMDQAGIEPRWVNGLRVTDQATMDVVQQVLAGSVNPEIVRTLVGHDTRAVGLTGIDAGLLKVVQRDPDLGFVGRVDTVDTLLLRGLVESGVVPVIAPIGTGPDGHAYNLNADSAAAAIAGALGAQKLIYLTDVAGVYRNFNDQESLVEQIHLSETPALLADLEGGMVPKIESSIEALNAGVRQVHILDGRIQHSILLEVFTPEGIGTMITQDDWRPVHGN
jgi:acetylglutamate kinase